jgi:molecular chaperone DnaK
LLPLAEAGEWTRAGWTVDIAPANAAADYFRCVLLDGPDSFRTTQGPIEGLVVSIPEDWRRRINDHRGAEILRQILLDELELPVDSLQSEPVCAAAYFARLYQQSERVQQRKRPFHGNLLICDLGGGTFDVALCSVDETQITVLDCDGNAEPGQGLAGVCFDYRAVERARDAANNAPPPSGTPAHRRVLRAFEDAKIDLHAYTRAKIELYADNPSLLGDAQLYEILGQYRVTYAQAEEAFVPVRVGIAEVLKRMTTRAEQQHRRIDRVAIVGGFGLFPLAQKAILEELGINEDDERFDQLISNTVNREYAVSRGDSTSRTSATSQATVDAYHGQSRCFSARPIHHTLTIVPGHPLCGMDCQLLGMPLQLRQIVERIGPAQLAGVDQAHIQIADPCTRF